MPDGGVDGALPLVNDEQLRERGSPDASKLLSASRRLRAQADSDRESVVDSSGMKGGGSK